MKQTTVTLPTITNINEARRLAHEFPAVITAGPSKHEVKWNHPNHLIRTFDDISWGVFCPSINDVEEMLNFASENNGDILIHCHAGMSRSTATAWGVAIQRGLDPLDAYITLRDIHPKGRMFWPNDAIVSALGEIFDIADLAQINEQHHFTGDHTL